MLFSCPAQMPAATAVFEIKNRCHLSLSASFESRVDLSKRDGVLRSSGATTRFISQADSSR